MKKVATAVLTMILAAGLLTACAGNREEGGGLGMIGSEASSGSVLPQETKTPGQMETEAQLRESLAALQEKQGAPGEQLAFYEELLARDLCREEDYLEMAELYGESGDALSQRRMLRWALRLYPGPENVKRLQELVVSLSGEEEPAAELIRTLRQALTEQDGAALKDLVKSESWTKTFQELPEIYATRTRCQAEDWVVQIVSDAYETEVFLLAGDGACLYGRSNDAGSIIGSAVHTDGAYNGDGDICWFDGENTLYKRYRVTMKDNICIDSVSVEYEGVDYAGSLKEDGAVAEQQQEKVTEEGGVVYAYQTGGNRYLYQEEADIETFRIDCEYVGLPKLDIWA